MPESALSSHHAPHSCIAMLGVPFDSVSMEDAVEIVENMVASGQPHYLATANVDFTVQALEDEDLRRILFDAHLVVCDGTPLVWASRWLGNRLPERVAGSDLVPILIRTAAQKGYRLYFLGGREEVTLRAIENITRQYPGLQVAGFDSPPFARLHEMDHEAIGKKIRAARPDFLFVSFGCPKQEKWIAMHYRSLGVPVSIGVGATIDFLAGEITRAPRWMHGIGLEWLYRLLQEPRRLFKRYVHDFWVFGRAMASQWWRLRPSAGPSATAAGPAPALADPSKGSDADVKVLNFPDRLDAVTAAESAAGWETSAENHRFLLADMANVSFVDSTGVGTLIRLQKRLRARQGQLILVQPSKAVLRGLELMKLTSLFPTSPDLESARALARPANGQAPLQTGCANAATRWSGEVTGAQVDALWSQLAEVIAARPHQETAVLIDLAGVAFIDSSGLGLMVRARRHARQNGVRLSFVHPAEPVRKIIRLARLEEFLLGAAQ